MAGEAPEPGTKLVRLGRVYHVVAVGEDEVRLRRLYAGAGQEVTETRQRFDRDLAEGVAVVHPDCAYCGLPVDPAEAEDGASVGLTGPVHYGCWYQHASVAERCQAEVEQPGGNRMASEALRADEAPQEYLLGVLGDPARSLHDRTDAEMLLTYAVDTSTIIDAQVQCPECLEGEVFHMDPSTGAVSCHCGHPMKPGDDEVDV